MYEDCFSTVKLSTFGKKKKREDVHIYTLIHNFFSAYHYDVMGLRLLTTRLVTSCKQNPISHVVCPLVPVNDMLASTGLCLSLVTSLVVKQSRFHGITRSRSQSDDGSG